jgi:hypothetical protein
MVADSINKAADAFGQVVMRIVRSRLASSLPRRFNGVSWHFPDVGAPMPTPVEKVAWAEMLYGVFNPLETTIPEIDELGRLLFDNNIYHRRLPLTDYQGNHFSMPTYEQARQFFVPTELAGIVINYLERHNSAEYDRDRFLTEFERYRASWSLPTTPIIAVIPLIRFSAEHVPIQVMAGLRIDALSGEVKTAAWPKSNWEQMRFPIADFAAARYCITGLFEQAREDRTFPTDDRVASLANSVVSSLRLLHPGHVAAPAGVAYTSDRIPDPSLEARWGNFRVPECEPNPGGPEYALAAIEVAEFKIILGQLQSLADGKALRPLAVALRRFNLSYSRANRDDEVIDLVVALESSLLHKLDDKHELSYRMALRGATLLRATRDPRATFQFLRNLYNARSDVVHSGRTLDEMVGTRDKLLKQFLDRGEGVVECVEEARQLTREVIRGYLQRIAGNGSIGAVNDELDQMVVGRLSVESSEGSGSS